MKLRFRQLMVPSPPPCRPSGRAELELPSPRPPGSPWQLGPPLPHPQTPGLSAPRGRRSSCRGQPRAERTACSRRPRARGGGFAGLSQLGPRGQRRAWPGQRRLKGVRSVGREEPSTPDQGRTRLCGPSSGGSPLFHPPPPAVGRPVPVITRGELTAGRSGQELGIQDQMVCNVVRSVPSL